MNDTSSEDWNDSVRIASHNLAPENGDYIMEACEESDQGQEDSGSQDKQPDISNWKGY